MRSADGLDIIRAWDRKKNVRIVIVDGKVHVTREGWRQ